MDNDQLELAQRRLQENVKTKVEADLFRYYRNLGSIIIAVLGAVGIAVGWPALKGLIHQEISSQIAIQVTEPVKEAEAATKKAQETARDADKAAGQVLQHLDELREDIGRVNVRYDEVSIGFGSAKTRLNSINDQVSELEEAIRWFRELAKRDPVGRAELESLKASIADIATRASDLAGIVGKSDQPQNASGLAVTLQQDLAQVATVQSDALKATYQATIVHPRGNSTVYVQFAGGSRGDIRAVTDLLRAGGWTVPGEERIASAAGGHEIRYYYDEDRKAAELLRSDLNNALVSANFRSTQINEVGDPLKISKLPAKGILEVWLEIPVK